MKKLQFIKKAVSGILCVGMLLESGTENQVYAAVINGEESVSVENSDSTTAVQQELPTGLMPVTEETDEAVDGDEEYSVYDFTQDDTETDNLLRSAGTDDSDWSKYGSRYFYNQMTEDEKSYWDAMDTICMEYLTTEGNAVNTSNGGYRMQAVWGSKLDADTMSNVAKIFRYSNPQYYFLGTALYTVYRGNEISKVWGIYPAFGVGAERAEATEAVKTQADTWQQQIDSCSTGEKKAEKIHDLICDKVYYNQALVDNNFSTENTEYSQSVYSVLCTDKTVCAGYAQAFEMMCNGSGIDAVAVTSYNHEWNKVRLYDSWYNVDCTWDDQSGGFYYNYFLRNDEYYDTCSQYSKNCHKEESYWEDYLPVCSLDSGSSWNTPGTLPEITGKADNPQIMAVDAGDKYYIQMICGLDGAQIYYNIEGRKPVVAAEKNCLYREGFYLDKSRINMIQAIAVKDTYYDSDAVTGIVEVECTHNYVSEITTDPTCTTTGIRTYTCEICGDSYEEVIEATGHTVVTDAAVAAACETTGLTEGSHCSVCGKVLTEQTVIPAAGHKWSEYRESGKVKRKCSVCGKTETVRTLPKVKMVQLSKTSYTYDGKSHMPAVKVTNSAGKKLKEGTDYKIKKPSGRKNAGIYTVMIEMKGDYTGKYRKTFQIIPKGTAISGVKAKKKAFSVSWKKQAKQTSGYQIQYAVDAKFKKSVVTKNVNNTKKVKLDVTKLKSKKKYYIRIRTYKTVKVNGKSKKIYSGWSKVKVVTTKK